MHNLTQTLLDAFRKLPVAVTIAVMMFAPASHVSLAEAPEAPKIVNFATLNKTSAQLTEEEQALLAAKIDKFYESKNMKLAGYGKDFIAYAVKYDLPDPVLLAGIVTIESSGGNHTCSKDIYNIAGWNGCSKIHSWTGFGGDTGSIAEITAHIAGEKPTTARYYDDKTVKQIINTYNPPSIVADYEARVMKVMKQIKETELS